MYFIFTMCSGPQNAVRNFAYTTTLYAIVNYTIVMIANNAFYYLLATNEKSPCINYE